MTDLKERKSLREPNMELLRIVAMLGITAMHYLYWNQAILRADVVFTGLRAAGSVVESFCVPMVAVYVMISGYYDCSTEFRWGRLLRLCAEVWFYSILIHLAAAAAGISAAGGSIWEQAVFFLPFMMNHYWFATAFVVMELFTPLLNAGVQKVSRRTLKNIILALLIYESVLKTVIPFQLTQDRMGYNAGFFLMIFLIGAYLREYGAPAMLRSGHRAAEGYVVSCILLAAEQTGAALFHRKTGGLTWLVSVPFHYNHLFAVSASVCLFLAFTHVKIREEQTERGPEESWQETGLAGEQNVRHLRRTPGHSAADFIRAVSPMTFGVYLIQCHADLLPLWPGWMAGLAGLNADTLHPVLFFLWMTAAVLIVYVVCTAVDWLRRLIFDGVIRLCRK